MVIRDFNQSRISKVCHYSYDKHKGGMFCVVLNIHSFKVSKIQGEHKVFPWLQTFVTRKLRGIQIYFF